MTIHIALFGYGRMGKAIESAAQSSNHFHIQSIHTREKSTPLKGANVAIDFSTAESIDTHIKKACEEGIPLLIGVTGISEKTEKSIEEAGKHIPICHAPNTSVAIAILSHFTEKAASLLKNYDIEISESHHKYKVDAPSGTALSLGKAAAKGRGVDFSTTSTYPHTGKRSDREIGFSVIRGGNVIGEHHIHFLGEEDTITLSHRALNRNLFAQGALQLAENLMEKSPGVYSVSELLGLES